MIFHPKVSLAALRTGLLAGGVTAVISLNQIADFVNHNQGPMVVLTGPKTASYIFAIATLIQGVALYVTAHAAPVQTLNSQESVDKTVSPLP